ncbi:MAG: helix-turn-helix transcriptional regulator [Ruminococcus sp.]|nr:helix-turn-helix transcriptional regulator [Ruminococcus sp.]
MDNKEDFKKKKTKSLKELQKFISNRIAVLRKENNISAKKMSLDLGKSQNYISDIENKKYFPSMNMFFRICKFFKITPKDFFDGYQKQRK